jgi:hypothetical protein
MPKLFADTPPCHRRREYPSPQKAMLQLRILLKSPFKPPPSPMAERKRGMGSGWGVLKRGTSTECEAGWGGGRGLRRKKAKLKMPKVKKNGESFRVQPVRALSGSYCHFLFKQLICYVKTDRQCNWKWYFMMVEEDFL